MDQTAGLGRRDLGHVAGNTGTVSICVECAVRRGRPVLGRACVEKEGTLFTFEDRAAGKIVDARC